jgi:hypothetical protein
LAELPVCLFTLACVWSGLSGASDAAINVRLSDTEICLRDAALAAGISMVWRWLHPADF